MIRDFLQGLKKKGYTQKQIAEMTGLTQPAISKMKASNECILSNAIKIADAFHVSLDEIAGRTIDTKTEHYEN